MITGQKKQEIIQTFREHAKDTGSTQVQIALLTKQIDILSEHCRKNRKDFSSKRGLLKLVSARRGFLKYLEKEDAQKYKKVIEQLGIRK